METLQTVELLTPEDETRLEFEALLGAFEDLGQDSAASQEERRNRDALIFNGLKKTLHSAQAMENIALLQDMSQRLSELACNHDHFASQLENYDVFGKNNHDDHAGRHRASKKDQDSKEKQDKKKKKKKVRGGLFRIFQED